eukprot:COSAG05_NODE_307_length_11680_cov_162.848804_10_plen_88_part_00
MWQGGKKRRPDSFLHCSYRDEWSGSGSDGCWLRPGKFHPAAVKRTLWTLHCPSCRARTRPNAVVQAPAQKMTRKAMAALSGSSRPVA